ncbi:MAG: hypothetical protein R3B96_04870 [Pirellulaceae bacterium]
MLRGLRAAFADNVSDDLFEDAVQDSLMKILRNLDSFEGAESIRAGRLRSRLRTAAIELRHRRYQTFRSRASVIPTEAYPAASPIGAKRHPTYK